ncbi:MAG: hypothetical protein ABIN67_06980 [Ferruginibacter sp.]
MKTYYFFLMVLLLLGSLSIKCSKPIKQEVQKPGLFITLKNDTGKSIAGATVRLYKNISDPGITQISDTSGVVIFSELDTTLYYWLAQKGCTTNRTSQTTLNRPLIPNTILYGYSVLAETGTLKIINNSPESYNVSDSLFKITLNKDTPYIAYRRARSYLIHSEKISTPGVGKDTLLRIKCGDTTILNLPY